MKNKYIALICGMMLIIGIIIFSNLDYHEEEVKCYDKYSNEIKGLNCLDNIPSNIFLWGSSFFLIVGGSIWGVFLGVLPGLVFGWDTDSLGL